MYDYQSGQFYRWALEDLTKAELSELLNVNT